jgi:hypothetical protein
MPRRRLEFMYPRGFIEEKRNDGLLGWDETDELENYDDDGLLLVLERKTSKYIEIEEKTNTDELSKWGLGIIGDDDDDDDWL